MSTKKAGEKTLFVPRTRRWLAVAVLGVFATGMFWETAYYGFFAADDNAYVEWNPLVLTGLSTSNVWTAFSTVQVSNYHPLTMISLMLDSSIGGVRPESYHRTNILLQAANPLLHFLLVRARSSAFAPSLWVAALFAAHPLHVEPVVWISGRKDVLSTFFWFAATFAYFRYTAKPSAHRYLVVSVLFLGGLFSKQMLVTLPFTFLLLDYWPLNRFAEAENHRKRAYELFREKLPLILVALIFSAATIYAQRVGGSVRNLEDVPPLVRVMNTPVAYVLYIAQTIFPINLQAIGYRTPFDIPLWASLLSAASLTAISVFASLRIRRYPYIFVGWFFYIGTLLPVIGLVSIGGTYRADRYMYIPLVGLLILLAWAVNDLCGRISWTHKRAAIGLAAAAVALAYTTAGWAQIGKWRDGVTLLENTVAANPDHLHARFALGNAYLQREDYLRAVEQYVAVMQSAPDFADAYIRMGDVQQALKNYQRAEFFYEQGIEGAPTDLGALLGLGMTKARLGKVAEAEVQFQKALALAPGYPPALVELNSLRNTRK